MKKADPKAKVAEKEKEKEKKENNVAARISSLADDNLCLVLNRKSLGEALRKLLLIQKEPDPKIPTAAVTMKKGRIVLLYNPEFISNLTDDDIRFVLIHEALHLGLQHFARFGMLGGDTAVLANLATDAVVNRIIKSQMVDTLRFSEGFINSLVSIDHFKEIVANGSYKIDLKTASAEEILYCLLDWTKKHAISFDLVTAESDNRNSNSDNNSCSSCSSSSSSSSSSSNDTSKAASGNSENESENENKDKSESERNGSKSNKKNTNTQKEKAAGNENESDKEKSKEDENESTESRAKKVRVVIGNKNAKKIVHVGTQYDVRSKLTPEQRELLKEMIKSVMTPEKLAGLNPGNEVSEIERLFKPVVNWRRELRKFVGWSSLEFERKVKWGHNRRKNGISPTFRKEFREAIIYVDTSGSISDKELEKFFSEIESLAKMNVKLYLGQFDAEMQDFREYKKGSWKKIKIKGRGGTAYGPVFDHLINFKHRAHAIILTDGYPSDPESVEKAADKLKNRVIFVLTQNLDDDKKELNPNFDFIRKHFKTIGLDQESRRKIDK